MVPALPTTRAVINTSSIQLACELGLRSTSRRTENFLASTAYRVAWKAGKYTPFVSLSTIDEDMEVEVTPVISSGAKRGETNITMGRGKTILSPPEMNFAMKLVMSRMNPNSPINRRFDNRWFIPNPHLRGMALYNFISESAERMVRGKRSSAHFLQSGWKSVKQKIKAMNFGKSVASGAIDSGDDSNPLNRLSPAKLGNAEHSGESGSLQTFTIENLIGTDGEYPNLSADRNQALMDHGAPALQRALDEQAQEMRDWNLNKDLEAELVEEWNSVPEAAPLKPAYGKGWAYGARRAAETESTESLYLGMPEAIEF